MIVVEVGVMVFKSRVIGFVIQAVVSEWGDVVCVSLRFFPFKITHEDSYSLMLMISRKNALSGVARHPASKIYLLIVSIRTSKMIAESF